MACRPRIPREDFEDDSSSSSDEEFAKNLPPMVRGKEDVDLFPYDILPSKKWLRYLREQGRDFERFLLLPRGFSFRCPRPFNTVDRLSLGEVAVYTTAFILGLRFPLHPFVMDVLDGCDIGLAKLTPNSWANVFGYIAKCALSDVTPLPFLPLLDL